MATCATRARRVVASFVDDVTQPDAIPNRAGDGSPCFIQMHGIPAPSVRSFFDGAWLDTLTLDRRWLSCGIRWNYDLRLLVLAFALVLLVGNRPSCICFAVTLNVDCACFSGCSCWLASQALLHGSLARLGVDGFLYSPVPRRDRSITHGTCHGRSTAAAGIVAIVVASISTLSFQLMHNEIESRHIAMPLWVVSI